MVSRARNLENYGFFIMDEIWRDVIGHEGLYKVSNMGNVKSCRFGKEKLLKQDLTNGGYYRIQLISANFVRKKFSVHRLVADAFLHGEHSKSDVINHIDEDTKNNKFNNLEYVSHRENISFSKRKTNKYSKYTGVTYSKWHKKFMSRININKKQIILGFYNNEFDAHLSYENALLKYGLNNKYSIDSDPNKSIEIN